MRFAYLIAAHNEFYILQNLLKILDSKYNDIYIHIDIKAGDIDYNVLTDNIKYANVQFIQRRSVTWGGYSQIQLELDLLKAATKAKHDYYHFISGVDLPIKTNEEIEAFFTENKGKEFIHFDYVTKYEDVSYRIGQYHWLQEKIGRTQKGLKKIDNLMMHLQRVLRINRFKSYDGEIKKGANWFSITHECAVYVVNEEKRIRKLFGNSVCADELFLQTIVYNSKFKESLYYSENEKRNFNMRLVDWNRGNPYIFRADDIDMLMKSDCIFARKFDCKVDKEIVDKLVKKLTLLR